MSTAFLHTHTLYLTPLSPLHLGSGEDYEPTHYLIRDGLLYAFDPAQAQLNPQQQQELLGVTAGADLRAIQGFFKRHPQPFIDCAHRIVAVSEALEAEYNQSLGQVVQREHGGKNVLNRLHIERSALNPVSRRAYIPGSALKGCLRTALLDKLSSEHPPQSPPNSKSAARYESELLGSFTSDILRLLKTADFSPQGEVATQIQYATNHKKHHVVHQGRTITARGPTGRRETIVHGQYRAFRASLSLQQLLLTHRPHIRNPQRSLPKAELQPLDLHSLAQAANRYHLPRFERETELLAQRQLVNPQWLEHTRRLLEALQAPLEAGHIMLLRLGKHGGAESKTLSNLAQIKIMQGKGQRPAFEPHTKTVWLAAQQAQQTHDLLPFGWALVEIDPQAEHTALQHWCRDNEQQAQAIHQRIQQWQTQQQAAAAARQQQQAEAAAQQQAAAAAAEAQAQAAAQRQAELNALPPGDRLAAEWLDTLQAFHFDARNQEAHTRLYQQLCADLAQAAETLERSAQQQLAQQLSLAVIRRHQPGLLNGKREKAIKDLLRRLRGE
ncbi:CRISPR-associated protein Csm5 [Neisseria sp. HSC-16F19]|nr:RAMP superfamily CRISPR-associated protein [Neisseria sp. HSC-16F19]MCP2041865.1 CRISPR-associated protein Csm5 [Neisseria sp. HSC-16F19]